MQFSINGAFYELSGVDLRKIAHGSTRTDEKGRTWFWNAPTKRWRIQKVKPDAPRQIAGLAVLDATEGDIRSVAGQPHEYRNGDWKPLEEGESREIGGETHVYQGGKFAPEQEHNKLRSRIEKRLQPQKASEPEPEPANQVLPSNVSDRKWIDSHLKGWNTELTRLGAAATEAIEEMQFNEVLDAAIDKLQGIIDGIQTTLDRADKIRGDDIVDRLNRTYEGKIDQVEARAARLYKRVYEAVHPDKIIRVPKGTTQREYADIVRKIHKGDKSTIKQYTIPNPKPKPKQGKRGKNMKKSAALASLSKSNDPVRYIMQWNRMELGVTHDPRFGDSRHGRKVTAGYGHIRGSYGHPDPVSGEAGDGMAIDVWIGCDLGSSEVFRIKQIKPDTKELDEWKYVIGCWTEQEATDLYLANMPKMFYGGVEKVSLEALKKYQKPVKLQKSFLLSGTLYQVQQHEDRLVLVKAAKKEAPGQMNLFGGDGGDSHWDESKHHRDAKGEFTSGGNATEPAESKGKPESSADLSTSIVTKNFVREIKENFHEKKSLEEAKDHGLDHLHPGRDWDEEFYERMSVAHRNGKLAEAVQEEVREHIDESNEGLWPMVTALAKLGTEKVDWDQISQFAKARLNHKEFNTENANPETQAVAKAVASAIDAGIDEGLEPKEIAEFKEKFSSDTDSLQRLTRRAVNTQSYDFDEDLWHNLANISFKKVDWDKVGQSLASALRLDKAHQHEDKTGKKGARLIPYEQSEAFRKYREGKRDRVFELAEEAKRSGEDVAAYVAKGIIGYFEYRNLLDSGGSFEDELRQDLSNILTPEEMNKLLDSKLQKTLVSLSGISYSLRQDESGLILVKASKKDAPGQMNLFGGDSHWDESKHHRDAKGEFTSGGAATATKDAPAKPADKKGFEGRAIAKIEQAAPAVIKDLQQKSKAFVQRIKSMPLSELQHLDLDAEMHDNYYLPAASQLLDAAKNGEHPDNHNAIEELDLDEHAPWLDEAWTEAYGKAEKVLSDRIDEIEAREDEIGEDAVSRMSDEGGKLIEDEPETLEAWQQTQEKLKALHSSIKASHQEELSKLGILPDWRDLDDELNELLDQYSSDPEDWED